MHTHIYMHTHTHEHIHRNMYISIFSPIFKIVRPMHFPNALLRIVLHLVFDSLTVMNVPITAYLVTLAFTYVLQPTNHLQQLLSHLPPSNLSCIFCFWMDMPNVSAAPDVIHLPMKPPITCPYYHSAHCHQPLFNS